MGIGSGAAAIAAGSLHYLQTADGGDNPLARSINREWEKIYRDQYKFDSAFDWVCSPNDTHACRVRAYVRNGIVTRMGATTTTRNTPIFTATKPPSTGIRASAPRATLFIASSTAPTGCGIRSCAKVGRLGRMPAFPN